MFAREFIFRARHYSKNWLPFIWNYFGSIASLIQVCLINLCWFFWSFLRRENYFKIWLHYCGILLVLLRRCCRYALYSSRQSLIQFPFFLIISFNVLAFLLLHRLFAKLLISCMILKLYCEIGKKEYAFVLFIDPTKKKKRKEYALVGRSDMGNKVKVIFFIWFKFSLYSFKTSVTEKMIKQFPCSGSIRLIHMFQFFSCIVDVHSKHIIGFSSLNWKD